MRAVTTVVFMVVMVLSFAHAEDESKKDAIPPLKKGESVTPEYLQKLLGKTVQEALVALTVKASDLAVGDEPPGIFRMVSGSLQNEPRRNVTIYIARNAAVVSFDRKAKVDDLSGKIVTGIAVSFTVEDKRDDIVVGEVIAYYHYRRESKKP